MEQGSSKLPTGLRGLYYIMGLDQAEDRLVYRRATEDIIATSRETLARSRKVLERLGGPSAVRPAWPLEK
jgi:hypothetical protein